MNLRKNLAALALAASMGISAACAMNVGVVDVQAVVQAYPGVESYVQKENAVKASYGPKLEKLAADVQAEADRDKAEKLYNETYVPVAKQEFEAINAVWADVFEKINVEINNVRIAKNLPLVVSMPDAIVSAEEGTDGINITQDVINAIKK